MKSSIRITRAGPLATIQDLGRFGYLKSGISASGVMDRSAFLFGAELLQTSASSGVEFTQAGIDFIIQKEATKAAFTGGDFALFINSKKKKWGKCYNLKSGDEIQIKPANWGNYGYVRFNAELGVKKLLGSVATNMVVGLGGLDGRALKEGDEIKLLSTEKQKIIASSSIDNKSKVFRFIWGIHSDKFSQKTRDKLVTKPFIISSHLNRMGVRLIDECGVFANEKILSLVSEPIVCGDIQILGDGTPIVLMRDHQPTGGYPRIGTIISADIDGFSQMRPNTEIFFRSITVEHAQRLKL